MTGLSRPRWWAQLRANLGGHFWRPCPACGVEFGGQDCRRVDGHFSDTPNEGFICPVCTAAGVGCRAHAERGDRLHVGCEFVDLAPGSWPGTSTWWPP
jgi:hypothetical protein